ncbi:hypothetical protein ATKI12_7670 [Kitasatospora sp. Ki12]
MKHRDVRGVARGGTESRGSARSKGFGGAGLVAAVTAGCAVAMLATGPSWALRRPEPRPAVDVVAPGAPGTSASPEVSTLPALAAAPSDSDLEVVQLDPDPAPPGGRTTIHAFIANLGPDTTASPVTVVVTLPEGVTPDPPFFPTDCEVFQNGHRVRCVFGPGLKEGRSATALIPVRLSDDIAFGSHEGFVALRSPDDRNGNNNRQPFDLKVVETA